MALRRSPLGETSMALRRSPLSGSELRIGYGVESGPGWLRPLLKGDDAGTPLDCERDWPVSSGNVTESA